MFRFIWAQLRGRKRRTLALLAGVLVATTGFTVLSAGAAITQLRINGDIQANYRPAYDILVRPKGSRTALEDERGVVRPNYLSGLFGGITQEQLAKVRSTPRVELGAPIAMLGYVRMNLDQAVDLTDRVDRTAQRQMFRLDPSWIADRGLTVLDDAPRYVYLTRDALYAEKFLVGKQPEGRLYQDGTELKQFLPDCVATLEVRTAARWSCAPTRACWGETGRVQSRAPGSMCGSSYRTATSSPLTRSSRPSRPIG